jgi:hypothetical protein
LGKKDGVPMDGTEFTELNFGGSGTNDNFGASGDSRTGGHHIMSVAETMARGLPPILVITQAAAHSAPTLANEYKVVNWLRAAAILAQIDPMATGYLVIDGSGAAAACRPWERCQPPGRGPDQSDRRISNP